MRIHRICWTPTNPIWIIVGLLLVIGWQKEGVSAPKEIRLLNPVQLDFLSSSSESSASDSSGTSGLEVVSQTDHGSQAQGAEVLPSPQPSSQDVGIDYRPLVEMNVNIAPPKGEFPADTSAQLFKPPVPESQVWCGTDQGHRIDVHWRSLSLAHRPLYFEDITLERYGHHHRCLQPVISAVKFYAKVPLLPYAMTVNHPRDCTYNAGHFRPGTCVPLHRYRCTKSLRATLVQGAVITGLVFLIP